MIYEDNCYPLSTGCNKYGVDIEIIKEYVKDHKNKFYMNGINIYRKANVIIEFSNNVEDEYYYFTTDDEGKEFVQELTEICENIGNSFILNKIQK